jgi:hypothetical protein
MDWWEQLGAHVQFFPDTPALALDMALRGPAEHVAYPLAYALQATPVPLEVYPPAPEGV